MRKIWCILRYLIEPSSTRGESARNLRRAFHSFQGTNQELAQALENRYFCTAIDQDALSLSYEGTGNEALDAPYTFQETKAALANLRRDTAPEGDRITVAVLANLSEKSIQELTDFINAIWDGAPIPDEWKTSIVHFIPKPGKEINTDNLRPISLTLCVGKLMEKMVCTRLSAYFEEQGLFSPTMFGFRAHLSTQDVLLQLKREVTDPPHGEHGDRAILTLDLKGAFDNVKHSKILSNLNSTNCGHKTFRCIQDFLLGRKACIKIDDTNYGPVQIGTRGTPQGMVLSPLLFNVAMMKLPETQNGRRGPPRYIRGRYYFVGDNRKRRTNRGNPPGSGYFSAHVR